MFILYKNINRILMILNSEGDIVTMEIGEYTESIFDESLISEMFELVLTLCLLLIFVFVYKCVNNIRRSTHLR